jgi:predicted nucleic acid-binding Zn ribbon protein
MPVTIPVTVYVPDLVVRRLSTEDDVLVAEYDNGPLPEQSGLPALWDESRIVLSKLEAPNVEAVRMYNTLLITMRQPRRVLDGGALTEFLTAARADSVAAFVHKYGLFRFPGPGERREQIRVSVTDFRNEQKRLRGLLRAWTVLKKGDREEAVDVAAKAGLDFAGDPSFALSVYLSARLAEGSTLGLIATEGRLEPMLYCRDVITGLYALLFQAVVAGRPWAICLNCENAFSVGRENKKFCSEPCQQAYKQRRYRNAEKQKSRKRKRKR